ncbi:4'-phosphopantetheinyl transferase superfamily protein [Actinosynnema sp. NPDC020468]|uniref:holo-ACP synthase n=1 Tax=Actinosynnema sp. NPDC020468 TaxID=3154488 RepID=UPI0033DB8EC0
MRIGVDLLRAHELDALLTRPWFRAFTYSPAELAVADGFGADRRREFLAGRFAAKEAVLKALGTGFGVRPHQVSVLRDAAGGPVVLLTGRAAEVAAGLDVRVSITHKADLVLAFALATP